MEVQSLSPKRPSEGQSRETAPGPSEKDLRRQLLISGIGSNARSSFSGTGGQIRWDAPLLSLFIVYVLSLFLVLHKHPIGLLVQVAALLLPRKECNYYKLSYPPSTFVKPNRMEGENKAEKERKGFLYPTLAARQLGHFVRVLCIPRGAMLLGFLAFRPCPFDLLPPAPLHRPNKSATFLPRGSVRR